MMMTTEQLDDGQITSFKIDTKRKIEELCNNVDNKCAKLVEQKNEEIFTEFEDICDAIQAKISVLDDDAKKRETNRFA